MNSEVKELRERLIEIVEKKEGIDLFKIFLNGLVNAVRQEGVRAGVLVERERIRNNADFLPEMASAGESKYIANYGESKEALSVCDLLVIPSTLFDTKETI